MSKILNAWKDKVNIVRQNTKLKIILISTLALLLAFSVTFAWYINKVDLWGMQFKTGTIDFITYVYGEDGTLLKEASSDEENAGEMINECLANLVASDEDRSATAYIALKSTGTIGIDYRVYFTVSGLTEKSQAYLGGYYYEVTKVNDRYKDFDGQASIDPSRTSAPGTIDDPVVAIHKNPVIGTLEKKGSYDIYRIDFNLGEYNAEYANGGINIFYNVAAVQHGGDFENNDEIGKIWNCGSIEDLNHARVEAYPGDIIKLCGNINYWGDLVFNKPVSLETNDFTLMVNGNLLYDYVLTNSLKIDAGGSGKIIVQCTNTGVGGNFTIRAPIGNVTLIGSNASTGDIVVEKNISIDATNDYGAVGVNFSSVKFLDLKTAKKTIQLESNTRATVSFDTTIGLLQSAMNASNIEIINNGVIGEINLSTMSNLGELEYPQIYILNNASITNPIHLPGWSVRFDEHAPVGQKGNTRIIQSFSGSDTFVTGNCNFNNDDVEKETMDSLVEQIEAGNDTRLKIYYQDQDGETLSIQKILEDYMKYVSKTGAKVAEIVELQIISVNNKFVSKADIEYMKSVNMAELKYLDMQRASIFDEAKGKEHRLPDSIFRGCTKFESLILPQNLLSIGANALRETKINTPVIIPAGVTEFNEYWFTDSLYVRFASSVPDPNAIANVGMRNVKAIFVEETYIASYKEKFSSFATRIYPVSVMDERKEHFVRNLKNNDWEITYYIGGNDTVIGENVTIDGVILNITSVYDNAYRFNYTGTAVKLADSVENLGGGNFAGYKNITTAELNKVKTLGAEAFSGCTSLNQVNFSEVLESIGAQAFYKCSALNQQIILPESMQTIGYGAFEKTMITYVHTGGTTSVDGRAFYECTMLVEANLSNVSKVAEGGTNSLFEYCTKLVSVNLDSLTSSPGNRMFFGCTSLREIYFATKDDGFNLPNGTFHGIDTTPLKIFVPEADLEFFRNKKPGNLTAEKIYPRGEKLGELLVNDFNIGEYIVMRNEVGNYSLVTSNLNHEGDLIIPDRFNDLPITRIYENAFRNQSFVNVTLKLGDIVESVGSYAFYNLPGLIGVDFGRSLRSIDSYAFALCSYFAQTVSLPETMESIGSFAFTKSGILSIDSGGTTIMHEGAFQNCTALTYAYMPELTTVGPNGNNSVFYGCSSLVVAEMPKVYRIAGTGMFGNCPSLYEVHVSHENPEFVLGLNQFGGGNEQQIKLLVPEHLMAVYQEKKFRNDTNQIFPQGERLGDKTVNDVRIGDYIVLENEEGYTLVTTHLSYEGEVTVPDEFYGKPITQVYANAFRNQSFTDATLIFGDNMKAIGNTAFYRVTGLNTLIIDQVTAIGSFCFYQSSIQSFNAPMATSIGDEAFRYCLSLQSISLPKIQTIEGSYVFGGCTELTSAYFEDLVSISYHTFNGDGKLEKLTINREIEDTLNNMPETLTLGDCPKCTIYVPYKSLWAYKNEEGQYIWSGKPVVSFDISAVHEGNTFILSDRNGHYALIDMISAGSGTTLVLPNSLLAENGSQVSIYSIEDGAFSSVSGSLKELTLASTVAKLDGTALCECKVLENIYVDAGNNFYSSVNGILYSKDGKMLVKYPAGRMEEEQKFDMTAADYASTVAIGAGAFGNATKLKHIVFPQTLSVIDSEAFFGCNKLSTVEFTGSTAPVLMGSGIFDTTVDNFSVLIPSAYSSAYTGAYNFNEYEPYMVLK